MRSNTCHRISGKHLIHMELKITKEIMMINQKLAKVQRCMKQLPGLILSYWFGRLQTSQSFVRRNCLKLYGFTFFWSRSWFWLCCWFFTNMEVQSAHTNPVIIVTIFLVHRHTVFAKATTRLSRLEPGIV